MKTSVQFPVPAESRTVLVAVIPAAPLAMYQFKTSIVPLVVLMFHCVVPDEFRPVSPPPDAEKRVYVPSQM